MIVVLKSEVVCSVFIESPLDFRIRATLWGVAGCPRRGGSGRLDLDPIASLQGDISQGCSEGEASPFSCRNEALSELLRLDSPPL